MPKDLDEITSELRELADDPTVELFPDLKDQLENLANDVEMNALLLDNGSDGAWAGVIECLQLGLEHINDKYGHSSEEADKVMEVIAKWS